MADRAGLNDIISRLWHASTAWREMAALELYRLGRALGDAALDHTLPGWRQMPDFAGLLAGPPTVGIAVQPGTFEKIRAAWADPRGLKTGSPHLAEIPPDQDAEEFELEIAPTDQARGDQEGTPRGAEPLATQTARLDILTTKAPGGEGAISRFLKRFGEGIQQVEYPTADVDRTAELLHTRFGLQLIYPHTRPGADGSRVNFFLASTPEGKKVLIELVQARRSGLPKT